MILSPGGIEVLKVSIGLLQRPTSKRELFADVTRHRIYKNNNMNEPALHVGIALPYRIKFTITTIPCPAFCLVSLLISRALADNLFEAGYRTIDELLNRPAMEDGVDSIPLPLKESAKIRRAIPLGQELNEIWNRVVLSGVRQSMRPYSLRVGAAGRLDGTWPRLPSLALSLVALVFTLVLNSRMDKK